MYLYFTCLFPKVQKHLPGKSPHHKVTAEKNQMNYYLHCKIKSRYIIRRMHIHMHVLPMEEHRQTKDMLDITEHKGQL